MIESLDGRPGDKPANVVLEVVVITSLAQTLRKGVVLSFLRISDIRPFPERTGDSDPVIIYLVTTPDPVRVSFVRFYRSSWRPETYMTWNGASSWRLRTSFQSAAPLQAFSSVPTLNPLQEWNMILNDSVMAGT